MRFIGKPMLSILVLTALAAGNAFCRKWSGDFICGTPHEPDALAKIADLPTIPKVYSGKSVAIMVKIAFSDAPYTVTDSTINESHATINNLYQAMSRNTFQFDFKIHSEVWTAPGTKAQYGANFNSLRYFIGTKLKENGYVKGTNYTVYVANFPSIEVPWDGLSNGPGNGGNYINGSYSAGVMSHELGHALGLPPAPSIEAGADMFGTPGTTGQHVEYGNVYDVMGGAEGLGHFNVNYKWRTGWIDKEEAIEVRNTGVYRLYAQDNPVHKGRLLGIRVPSVDTRYAYWLEYRTVSTSARLGAAVMFEGFQGAHSRGIHLLDMTPGSRTSGDAQDAVLVPGKEFTDKYGTAIFKTFAINTGVWNEEGWVDLQVTIPGSIPVSLARNSRIQQAMHPGEFQAFNIMGRAMGFALPAQALVVKSNNGKLGLAQAPSLM